MSKLQMNHLNEGEIFFRSQHPDKRTGPEWVRFMNKKFGLTWGIGKRELKKREEKVKRVKKTTKRKKK